MKKNKVENTQIPKLTIEEINKHEEFKNYPHDKKIELIDFVYEMSLALYHSYNNANEKQH